MPRRTTVWLALLTLAAAAAACGNAASEAGACVELREPADPASDRHVLADGAFVYQTDPPTSGAHVAGPTPSGLLERTVAAPIQVRLLEAGGVMVQFDPSLIDPVDLEPLGADLVAIAPGEDLPGPLVATAWTWKLTCETVDVDRLRMFIAERPAAAPGLD